MGIVAFIVSIDFYLSLYAVDWLLYLLFALSIYFSLLFQRCFSLFSSLVLSQLYAVKAQPENYPPFLLFSFPPFLRSTFISISIPRCTVYFLELTMRERASEP